MKFTRALLLVLLISTAIATAQSTPQTATPETDAQPASTSSTYSDTLRKIKNWIDSEQSDDLARLFAIGDDRTSDLVTACRSSEAETAVPALLTLQLLGKPQCKICADSVSQSKEDRAWVCGPRLNDSDFNRIEHWLVGKRKGTGYECGDDYDALSGIDDAAIYALILDGSPRSQSLLESLLTFYKACAGGGTIKGEILQNAHALILASREAGNSLRAERDKLDASVRASAFFLPDKYRKDSHVTVLGRNKTRNRILLEVSYRCGNLCGAGYYVVLERNSNAWRYALIRMAWIS